MAALRWAERYQPEPAEGRTIRKALQPLDVLMEKKVKYQQRKWERQPLALPATAPLKQKSGAQRPLAALMMTEPFLQAGEALQRLAMRKTGEAFLQKPKALQRLAMRLAKTVKLLPAA